MRRLHPELRWQRIDGQPQQPRNRRLFSIARTVSQQLIPETLASTGGCRRSRWRATRPEVQGARRFSSLRVGPGSLRTRPAGKIAAELLRVKDDSDELQTWTNTLMGEGWREAPSKFDATRSCQPDANRSGLDRIPAEVHHRDVRRRRAKTIGSRPRSSDGATRNAVLAHTFAIWGSPDEATTLAEL
mgnify:CR=1 FL=1